MLLISWPTGTRSTPWIFAACERKSERLKCGHESQDCLRVRLLLSSSLPSRFPQEHSDWRRGPRRGGSTDRDSRSIRTSQKNRQPDRHTRNACRDPLQEPGRRTAKSDLFSLRSPAAFEGGQQLVHHRQKNRLELFHRGPA